MNGKIWVLGDAVVDLPQALVDMLPHTPHI